MRQKIEIVAAMKEILDRLERIESQNDWRYCALCEEKCNSKASKNKLKLCPDCASLSDEEKKNALDAKQEKYRSESHNYEVEEIAKQIYIHWNSPEYTSKEVSFDIAEEFVTYKEQREQRGCGKRRCDAVASGEREDRKRESCPDIRRPTLVVGKPGHHGWPRA